MASSQHKQHQLHGSQQKSLFTAPDSLDGIQISLSGPNPMETDAGSRREGSKGCPLR